ncbi:MAG: 16S rRNA (adenine(1518)-N(6)/adenine(1519)-N(6))-dimethyltransferase RsmA [Candidatus Pacebacteria bacterium]|nr:16S rRNA (adenine(1518)-N(6)/adenine(1519)-N(6))-dimethyltransferase RsmA [Candidatus Paceibacterota bacterium]
MIHKAKKSLGQNFLKSEMALKKIVEAGEVKKSDIVLEIGPGKGALTSKLLEKAKTVIAVEKDRELFEFLKEKFKKEIKSKSLLLIQGDILEFDPLLISPLAGGEGTINYKIIANIPYNITGAILKKFLTAKNQPERMILMVQHEVAKRIMARDPRHGGAGGKESILSISVKAYGEPKMIMKVNKRYFSPAPKVDSAIIAIKNISRERFTLSQNSPHPNPLLIKERETFEEKFWEIVKTGFAHKRKKLSSNLKNVCQSVCQSKALANLGNKRAEDLTLNDWIMLTKGEMSRPSE